MKIAIASGKGGTGKTFLASNLSAMLALRQKTFLVDLDVEEPNSALFFNGKVTHEENCEKMIPEWDASKCTSCGQCQQVCNFNAVIKLLDDIIIFPELCHSCYACSELCPESALPMRGRRMGSLKIIEQPNLTFIESRLDIGQEQAVPLISQTFAFIEKQFKEDLIYILDAPPGTSCPLIEVSLEANFVILVTEPTPFGLHDLKLSVETMRLLKRDFAVVINRCDIGNDEVEEYCIDQEIPLIAKIPNKRRAAELYSMGRLVYQEIPEIQSEIQKVLDYILIKNKSIQG